MILYEFPDVNWVRAQSKSDFANQKGIRNIRLPDKGWPSVVLHTTSFETERADILAPFSMFMNLTGNSIVHADNRPVQLNEDNFCLVNNHQHYDLIIPKGPATNVFNIHFGIKLYQEVLHNLTLSPTQLLDYPEIDTEKEYRVFVKSRWKSPHIIHLIERLRNYYTPQQIPNPVDDEEYALLGELLVGVLMYTQKDLKMLQHISSIKQTTKIELIKRLMVAVDYMHYHYPQKITLEELSKVSCLSIFHFIRTFKEVFRCTPYQYIRKLRLDKAENLLRHTQLEVAEIALRVGFEEPNSFYRFFHQHHPISPATYRLQK